MYHSARIADAFRRASLYIRNIRRAQPSCFHLPISHAASHGIIVHITLILWPCNQHGDPFAGWQVGLDGPWAGRPDGWMGRIDGLTAAVPSAQGERAGERARGERAGGWPPPGQP